MPPRAFLAVVLLSGHAGAGRLICSRATSGVEHGIADAATMAFMNDTDLTDVNKPALVFDVGANNGDYSCKLLETLRSRVHSRRVHLHMIEPQPQFRRGLQRIADHFGGTFVGKAAWRGPPTNSGILHGGGSARPSILATLPTALVGRHKHIAPWRRAGQLAGGSSAVLR